MDDRAGAGRAEDDRTELGEDHPGVLRRGNRSFLLDPDGEAGPTGRGMTELRRLRRRSRVLLLTAIGAIPVTLLAANILVPFLGSDELIAFFIGGGALVAVTIPLVVAMNRAERPVVAATSRDAAVPVRMLDRYRVHARPTTDWRSLWRLARELEALDVRFERLDMARTSDSAGDTAGGRTVDGLETEIRASLDRIDELSRSMNLASPTSGYRAELDG